MEATCSSETPVDVKRATRRYIPEDTTLHNQFRFECTLTRPTSWGFYSDIPGMLWLHVKTQQISSKSLIPRNLHDSVRDFKTPTT
jgi:hypothetical protein